MKLFTSPASFLILALLALPPFSAALPSAPTPGEPEGGAVIEEVTKGWAAERAGIRPGDLLLSWSQGNGKSGRVRSLFDLGQLEIEQAPHGLVTLRGTREGGKREWILPPGRWGLKARPTLKDSLRAAWLEARLARELADAGRWSEAETALDKAVQRLEASQPVAAAQLLRDWARSKTFQRPDLWDRAESRIRQALALEPKESLAAAWDLTFLGMIARERGDYAAAEDLIHKACAIQQKLAPGGVVLAWMIQRELAILAYRRGDLAGEEKTLLGALKLLELAPEGLELAVTLNDLGENARRRGNLLVAEERLQRALSLIEHLSPDSPEHAHTLGSLGLLDVARADLASAEARFQRAIAILADASSTSLHLGYFLTGLAYLAEERNDVAAAKEYYRRSLQASEKLARGASDTSYYSVYYLMNLAVVARANNDLAKADEYLQRALDIQDRDKSSPQGYHTAMTCYFRALMAVERGDLLVAEEMHSRVLAILEKQSPEGMQVGNSLHDLGNIAFQRGDLTKARELFQRAIAIREKMAPGSMWVGSYLNRLGHVDRREGRLETAAEHLCRATELFDRQRKKFSRVTEGRSAFGGTTAEAYRDCLAALVDIGRPEEAFRALERGRARSFLDLLAERDLRWTADLPADLAKDRKQTDAEYDRTQAALNLLSPIRDQAEVDRLLVRLRELRARQEEIAAKVRRISPRAAALQDPRPLDLSGARAALDPGTLLLTWSIGRERSFLFAVQPARTDPGLEVFPIAITDQALRERVGSFRNLLQRADSDRAVLSRQARELYDILFRPAEARISAAARLLVSPDGPLHILPFSALVRDGRWLAEQKPIHTVLSATVYAELQKSRQQGAGAVGAVLAFGDPSYPPLQPGQTSTTHVDVRAAIDRGLSLTSLPATRQEVQGIASLYPQARLFLGAEATEERARSAGQDARYLHFACHGLLDERFPLNSGLALAIPEHPKEGQENGLLQAWEIFEHLRLDADLVTLSACDSGLGQEMGGEGLLGLTRAFQYAGARAVLASLWSVSDTSTARLMQSFYTYLRQGQTKDQALRAAQVDLIRSRNVSHPYYWAAFQLSGDWK